MEKINLKEIRKIKKEFDPYIDGGSDTWIKLMFLMDVIHTLTYHKNEITKLDSYWQYKNKDWNWEDDKSIKEVINTSFSGEEISEIKTLVRDGN